MSIPLIHLNPDIFPEPEKFIPDRWINSPQLNRYLLSFSKGPRACVGLNLAWAELYHTVATVFGHYGDEKGEGPSMRLYQTTQEDVKAKHDFFVPGVKLDSKGVRVVVSG
jgi:cytochrome P450